ncbi:MAG: nucleotidyltransferase domain-containing protein [Armatimonadetes bacterium]|nr:nucleotidyltransferase domain-containing protein [Armatimonadota bacterium]
MDLDALRPELERLFQAHPVRLAYLFGSHAAGRAHADSDVDVAVLLDEHLTADERFAQRLELIGELMRVFRTEDVDVVILNEAPPALAYEVLRGGRVLFRRDEQARIEYAARTLREYWDTAPLRRIRAEALERRVRSGQFGQPAVTKHPG